MWVKTASPMSERGTAVITVRLATLTTNAAFSVRSRVSREFGGRAINAFAQRGFVGFRERDVALAKPLGGMRGESKRRLRAMRPGKGVREGRGRDARRGLGKTPRGGRPLHCGELYGLDHGVCPTLRTPAMEISVPSTFR